MRRLWEMARGATARKGYVALVDQAIVSGTNFSIAILLARFCTEEEYGAYFLAFATALLLTALSGALITEPMTVLGAPREGEAFTKYATSLFVCQIVVASVCAIGVCVGALLISCWSNLSLLSSALYGLGSAIVFLQGREFFRCMFFAQLRPKAVLVNDFIYCSVVIAGIFVLRHFGIVRSRNVFLVMGSVGLVSCATAFFQAHGVLTRPTLREVLFSLRENWALARWNLAISVSHFGFSRAEAFVLAGYIGTAASGKMAAARNILAPLHILIFAVGSIAAPRAAILFSHEGRQQMNRLLMRASLLVTALCGIYCLGAALFPNVLLQLFYGTRYLGEGNIVRLWAAIYFVTTLSLAPSIGIKSMRRPDIVFGITFAAAAVALGLCFRLVPSMQLTGAMLSHLCAVILIALASTFAFFWKGIENRPVLRETPKDTDDRIHRASLEQE